MRTSIVGKELTGVLTAGSGSTGQNEGGEKRSFRGAGDGLDPRALTLKREKRRKSVARGMEVRILTSKGWER